MLFKGRVYKVPIERQKGKRKWKHTGFSHSFCVGHKPTKDRSLVYEK